jgi:FkbM family methyltransferase
LVNIHVNGYKVYGYSYSTLIILYRDIFLKELYHFSSTKVAPFIIDCGANIGMSILYFKYLYPQARIIAFEPNPHSFQILEMNIKINQLSDITLYNMALSDVNGSIDFYLPSYKGSLNGSLLSDYIEGDKIQVAAAKLSSYLKNCKVDFVKMDIEGAENMVIKDLYEHDLLNNIDDIKLEYHQLSEDETLKHTLISYFESKGFLYEILEHDLGINNPCNFIIKFQQL